MLAFSPATPFRAATLPLSPAPSFPRLFPAFFLRQFGVHTVGGGILFVLGKSFPFVAAGGVVGGALLSLNEGARRTVYFNYRALPILL